MSGSIFCLFKKSWQASWAIFALPILAVFLLQAHHPGSPLPHLVQMILTGLVMFHTVLSSGVQEAGSSPSGGPLIFGAAAIVCKINRAW